MNNTIKLHVAMARSGLGSRRACEKIIESAKVEVNNQVAKKGQRVDPIKDEIKVEGKLIKPAQNYVYFLIDKPRGLVSTVKDELNRRTVLKCLPQEIINQYQLHPVGRLDLDSEGLLMLTNDGPTTQKFTHPSFEIQKTYHVLLDRPPTKLAINHLRKGVKLQDGFAKVLEINKLEKEPDNQWFAVTISEGRNRQIRRMMERIGYDVSRLIRVKFHKWSLEDLKGKTYIQLNQV